MSNMDEKDLAILKLQIQLLEEQLKSKDRELTSRDREILALSERLDEPAPILSREPIQPSTIQNIREELSKLTPGELFVLCKRKGIKIEEIFPL